ncbi:MAG: hypothetical protein M3370_13390 [Actinomycetota bacterium]|nr:hypothetical protein [Actinomycetota bacterium]
MGDHEALPDIATIGDAIEESVAELASLAQRERSAAPASA